MEKVTPMCRYGHGPLELAPSPHGDERLSAWALESFSLMGAHEDDVGEPLWTLALYRCNACGYLELFDKEVG